MAISSFVPKTRKYRLSKTPMTDTKRLIHVHSKIITLTHLDPDHTAT